MEARLRVAESKALSETTKRAETDHQLAAAQARVEQLEELAAEASAVPTLRDDLAKAESLVKDLTEMRDSLQVQLLVSMSLCFFFIAILKGLGIILHSSCPCCCL
jgi:hypothetical protein